MELKVSAAGDADPLMSWVSHGADHPGRRHGRHQQFTRSQSSET